MSETIQQLMERFPDKEDRIRQLWAGSEDFRELVNDYAFCLAAEASPESRTREYGKLRRRLEVEISSIVEEWGR